MTTSTVRKKRLSYLWVKLSLLSFLILAATLGASAYLTSRDLVSVIGERYEAKAVSVPGSVGAAVDSDAGLSRRDDVVRRYIYRSVSYEMGALLLIVMLFYLMMRRYLFDPLNQLTHGAREVAKGNFDGRTNLPRGGELGELSREFDLMTDALQRREEENKHLLEMLKEKWHAAEAKSNTDFLTGLENHRAFHAKLEAELNRSSRVEAPVSLLFCDLDRFKSFNDSNGHVLGDRALVDAAAAIRDSIRDYDVAARYGGEEFAVILANADADEALAVGERIRSNIEKHVFAAKEGAARMTISIGLATYPRDAKKKELLIAAADFAMYEAKRQGGNAVAQFKPQRIAN